MNVPRTDIIPEPVVAILRALARDGAPADFNDALYWRTAQETMGDRTPAFIATVLRFFHALGAVGRLHTPDITWRALSIEFAWSQGAAKLTATVRDYGSPSVAWVYTNGKRTQTWEVPR